MTYSARTFIRFLLWLLGTLCVIDTVLSVAAFGRANWVATAGCLLPAILACTSDRARRWFS